MTLLETGICYAPYIRHLGIGVIESDDESCHFSLFFGNVWVTGDKYIG